MPSHNPHRVYIPTNAHSNQYLLAEIKLNDTFYSHYASADDCYQGLAQQLFSLADKLELRNVHLIANDKLPVVRFHTESYTFQTEKQILFFYHPKYHEGQNLFATPGYQARKIRLLFLATGEEIRSQAASLHSKVVQLLTQLKDQLAEPCPIKLRDHQHLSYDLFAKAKGHKESYGYKLRGLYPRYQARQCELPAEHSEITYITVTLPLSRALKQQFLHERSDDFSPLYQALQDKFQQACSGKKLDRLAMVANGLTPLVRNSKWDQHDKNRELQKISFDPDCSEPQFLTFWQADGLVESAHFVLVANNADFSEMGYGRFMNQVEEALRSFAKSIEFDGQHQNLTVRFFQHISYVI